MEEAVKEVASDFAYYVHYVGFDRRLDEWVELGRLDLTTVEVRRHEDESTPTALNFVLPSDTHSRTFSPPLRSSPRARALAGTVGRGTTSADRQTPTALVLATLPSLSLRRSTRS